MSLVRMLSYSLELLTRNLNHTRFLFSNYRSYNHANECVHSYRVGQDAITCSKHPQQIDQR